MGRDRVNGEPPENLGKYVLRDGVGGVAELDQLHAEAIGLLRQARLFVMFAVVPMAAPPSDPGGDYFGIVEARALPDGDDGADVRYAMAEQLEHAAAVLRESLP